MLRQYPKEVKLVYKEFPLSSHRFSAMASLAAIAAGRQGKYWQMHDKIFAAYSSLTEERLKAFARELDLNMSQFDRDRNTLSAKQHIKHDIQDGVAAGVRGTPTIFINGRLLRRRSLPGFKQMISQALAKAAGR